MQQAHLITARLYSMKRLLQRFLSPPVFENSEMMRQADVLHYSSLMVAAFGLSLIMINLISGVESEIALNWSLSLLILFQIPVQVLMRLGKINQASLLLITICWFVTTVVSRSMGGVRDVSIVVYVLILLGSGFLIGWYFAIVCMAFNIAAIWWLASLETNGVLVPVFGNPYRIAIDLTVIFILMLAVVYFFVQALTKALEKARMELVERTRIESEREKLILQLSEEIKERKRAEDGLKQLARTDPLTGLFNRRHFLRSPGTNLPKQFVINAHFLRSSLMWIYSKVLMIHSGIWSGIRCSAISVPYYIAMYERQILQPDTAEKNSFCYCQKQTQLGQRY